MSPVERHKARWAGREGAAQAAAPEARRRGPAATEYELWRARLGNDLRRLKEIQSIERKIELKRKLLPEYVPWVKGVLAADVAAEDDILAQIMVWLFDVGEFYDGLELARFMLRHKLSLPERFKRTLGTFIVEETAEAAEKARVQVQDFSLPLLFEVELLCSEEDMPDAVRAKQTKEIGLLLARDALSIEADADGPAGQRKAGIDRALAYLRRALALESGIGVKGDVKRLEAELKKLVQPET
jgi:Phage small terminase subunit